LPASRQFSSATPKCSSIVSDRRNPGVTATHVTRCGFSSVARRLPENRVGVPQPCLPEMWGRRLGGLSVPGVRETNVEVVRIACGARDYLDGRKQNQANRRQRR
jgi:hypothetical protein